MIHVNTSNPGKQAEYRRVLGTEVIFTSVDLAEPLADALTIVRYKASQFPNALIDDVALWVEGEAIGSMIRWHLDQLDRYIGRPARFECTVGIFRNDQVEIYRGETEGRLVSPRGKSYGFNPFFLPDGGERTFGEEIPDDLNPRVRALRNFLAGHPHSIEAPLLQWNGRFQPHE